MIESVEPRLKTILEAVKNDVGLQDLMEEALTVMRAGYGELGARVKEGNIVYVEHKIGRNVKRNNSLG